TKFGNTYLYQAGFGRNIKSTHQWLFAWMLEGDGSYTQKNRISGVIDPNSGGNVIYLTPSIFVSNNGFIFQLGAGWPLTQHLNGVQGRDSYLLAASLGFRLN
ncbi:MAG TPA: hypothetical protein VLH77_06765, partial [Gammaproteobacteria bacterium]|nr:hypothetical protein [Gammaproteobacteria bacterium]